MSFRCEKIIPQPGSQESISLKSLFIRIGNYPGAFDKKRVNYGESPVKIRSKNSGINLRLKTSSPVAFSVPTWRVFPEAGARRNPGSAGWLSGAWEEPLPGQSAPAAGRWHPPDSVPGCGTGAHRGLKPHPRSASARPAFRASGGHPPAGRANGGRRTAAGRPSRPC